VIVVLQPSLALGSHRANVLKATETAQGLGLSPRFAFGTALFGFAADVPEGRLLALEHDPRVAYLSPDGDLFAADRPDARASAKPGGGGGGASNQTVPWGVQRVSASSNLNDGAGIQVFVLDTGIDSDHPDLQAHLGSGYSVVSCNSYTTSLGKLTGKQMANLCRESWDDDNGHGTHVAGTIGAIDNTQDVIGVADQVTLHSVKVGTFQGGFMWSSVIAGIDWITQQTQALGQATVANMSFGGAGSKTGTCSDTSYVGDDAFHNAICNAKNAGVIFIASAGNEGGDAAGHVPAAYDDAVITVSATDSGDNWASWSNWGNDPAVWDGIEVFSAPVAIAAPGVDVLSTLTNGGTTTRSGTSMATAHVAGAVALYLKSHPSQPVDGSAFRNARTSLLTEAEDTAGFGAYRELHPEGFLNADSPSLAPPP
jgi:subtilisin